MKPSARLLVPLGIAGLLLVLLMSLGGVGPLDALRAVARLPPSVYLLALGMHLATYALRALRLRLLLPREVRPPFRRALAVSSAHNMASYLVPAKAGEAALVMYLKLHCGVPSSVGLAALFVSRFLDGATLCLGLSLACFWLRASGLYPGLEWLGSVGGMLAALSALFVALSMRSDLALRVVGGLLGWLKVHRWRVGQGLLVRTNGLALALRAAGEGRRLPLAGLATLPVWISTFGFYTVLARAMGLPERISFAEATFGSSLASLCNLLPLNGAAGVGTQELGWVTGFHRFLGVDYDVALSTGIGVHLVQLFNIVALGLVAHLVLGVAPRLGLRRAR